MTFNFRSIQLLQLFVTSLWVSSTTTATAASDSKPRLFPAAKQEQYDAQTLLVRTFQGENLKFRCSNNGSGSDNKVVMAAMNRFRDFLKLTPDYPEDYPINPDHLETASLQFVDIHLQENHTTKLYQGFDESYQIHIDSEGAAAKVEAKTVFGVVRGLESLAQLFEFGWLDPQSSTPLFIIRSTPLFIADAPTYSYRGLMIDTSRHYLPMGLILSNLDVMAMNKFNVLHWHVTDRQSWPFQSETFPELSEKGAYHKNAIYTHKDVQEVIDEGYLRGIRVIPEFDLPGHSQVLDRSHSELMSHCPGESWASQPLDPTLPEVYDFVEQLYREVTSLFVDQYIHIGGDEVRLDCWSNTKSIQKWAKAHNHMTDKELLNYFESILTDIVASCDKIPIAWQELLNEGVDLPPGTVIDVWKGFDTATIENATKRGYPVLISGCWYLDHLKDTWSDYYHCEPLAFNGTHSQKKLIMGGHASMWGERVDASNFMERVWPRASAVAERLWSGSLPKAYHDMIAGNVEDRIAQFRCFMVLRGVSAAPVGPGSCEHEQPFPPSKDGKDLPHEQQYRLRSTQLGAAASS